MKKEKIDELILALENSKILREEVNKSLVYFDKISKIKDREEIFALIMLMLEKTIREDPNIYKFCEENTDSK